MNLYYQVETKEGSQLLFSLVTLFVTLKEPASQLQRKILNVKKTFPTTERLTE